MEKVFRSLQVLRIFKVVLVYVCGKKGLDGDFVIFHSQNKLLESKVELDEIILPYIRLDGYQRSRYVTRVEIEKVRLCVHAANISFLSLLRNPIETHQGI